MSNVRLKPSKFLIYSFYVISAIVLAFIAFIFQNKNIEDIVVSSLTYVENENTDYKVYLKENSFYTQEYLPSNETDKNISYVTSYIDYIDFNYNYIANFTEHIDGNYEYYIKGELIVYDPDNKDDIFWSKDYDLMQKTSYNTNDTGSYSINQEYKFDFPTYLNEYNEYKKKDPSVISDAKFIITFYIVNKALYTGMDDIEFKSNISYSIPLSESTFKITKSSEISTDAKTLNNVVSNDQRRAYVKAISIIGWLGCAIMILKIIFKYFRDYKNRSLYDRKLAKILNTYDSIIVNVSSMQSLEGLSIVNVDSFEELVDAQAEVRLPINFKENKEKKSATFILVRNTLAWVYILRESDLED